MLYDRYFTVAPADTPALLDEAHALRYQVYCVEHPFEDPSRQAGEREFDQYDTHSVHAVLIYRPTGRVVGCVRLILPTIGLVSTALPMRDLLNETDRASFDRLPRMSTAEISRYAVSKAIRRRDGETLYPDLSFYDFPPDEIRRLVPHMSLGLLSGVAALAAERGITHVAAAMAPALLRLLERLGITFDLLGPRIEYHGERQACVASCESILAGMARCNKDYHQLVAAAYRRGAARLKPRRMTTATRPDAS